MERHLTTVNNVAELMEAITPTAITTCVWRDWTIPGVK